MSETPRVRPASPDLPWMRVAQTQILTLVERGMAGTLLDPEALDPDTGAVLPVTEIKATSGAVCELLEAP